MKKIITILFLIFSFVSKADVKENDLNFLSAVYFITATEDGLPLEFFPIPKKTFDAIISVYPKNKDKIEVIHCGYICFKEKINQRQYFWNSIEIARNFVKKENMEILRLDIRKQDTEESGGWFNIRALKENFLYDFYVLHPSKNGDVSNLPAPYPVTVIIFKIPMD